MTAIIAVKATKGLEGIVVIADNQLTIVETLAEDKYDVPQTKRVVHKLVKGKNWVIGYSGGSSDDQIDRFAKIFNGSDARYDSKKSILKAVSRYDLRKKDEQFERISADFQEVNLLNTHLMKCEGASLRDTYEFILAVNKPKVRLFHVDEFGNLRECEKAAPYLCIGSGKKEAEKYIEDHLNLLEEETPSLTISDAIILAKDALEKAGERDPYTSNSGDIAILTKNKIKYFGNEMSKVQKKAKDALFRKIISFYKK